MKKLFSIVFMGAWLLSSCDVLDVKPYDRIPASQVFEDKRGIEKAILGSYSAFQSLSYYGRTFVLFNDLAADNLAHPVDATSSEYAQVAANAILAENGSVEGIWRAMFDGINMANNVMAAVPGMGDMEESEKNKAIAEVRFLRALHYFNLVNLFGAVPIKDKATLDASDIDAPRQSVDDVYNFIITDLQFAEKYLTSGVKVRASKWAAKALLAKVYLYRGGYALAASKASAVIDSAGLQLPAYASVFEDGSSESIFEIDFSTQNRNRIAEYHYPKTLTGRREVEPSASILSAYEPNDERYAASIAFSGALAYAQKNKDLAVGDQNFIVLRLADMYLVRAEALARNNGSVSDIQDDINIIRNRAGLGDVVKTSYSDLLLAIEKERRVEFAFEGQRWFDLVRTGRASTFKATVTSVTQTLFPIPLTELVTNRSTGMYQNDGY
jgi:hypothetical protein